MPGQYRIDNSYTRMRVFLFILCVLSFLAGVMTLAGAKSAIHEIEAFLLFLIGAVFLVGAAIVEAIHRQRK
jgi:quinol-cytochrome oxidoreductase complex cytochrome b subunit